MKKYILILMSLFLISFVSAFPVDDFLFYDVNSTTNYSIYINSTVWMDEWRVTDEGFIQFYNVSSNSTDTPIFYNTNLTWDSRIDLFGNSDTLKNALVFMSNTTVCGSDVNLNDDNVNCSIPFGGNITFLNKFNLTENIERNLSPIWINHINTFSSGGIDTKTYYIGNNLTGMINFTSYLISNCPSIGDTVRRINSISGQDDLVDYYCVNSTILEINVTNFEYSTGSNQIIITYYNNPQGGGGSGGGGIDLSYLGLTNISKAVCDLTYEDAKNKSYLNIYDIIDILKIEEKETYNYLTIKTYIDNWQPLCSSLTNKTLKPELVCTEIYYFILSNNYNYTYQDFMNLKYSIKNQIDVPIDVMSHYLEEYNTLCYLEGYSSKLPDKPVTQYLKIFNYTNCSLNLGNKVFDATIPLGKFWELGETIDCSFINFWRWIFRVEKINNIYYFTGIRLWIPSLFILGIILVVGVRIKIRRKKKN